MSLRIRRADVSDVPSMVAIKQALRLEDADDGGFLLGTSAEGYATLVAVAETWTLCDEGRVVGFAIALPDAVVRHSELWERRDRIVWENFDASSLETMVLGYFDQLAVLAPYRAGGQAALLAARPVAALLDAGCTDLFATTVREPVTNRAAWSLLAGLGARRVGRVDEVYPDFGPLLSDLHHVPAAVARARLALWQRGAPDTGRERLAGPGT